MTLSSDGDRKEQLNDLITPLRSPNGCVLCVDVVWVKPNMTAVLKARPKAWLSKPSDQCLQQLNVNQPTAKRSVTHAATQTKNATINGSLTSLPD